jgi:hypothetical protein
MQREVIEIDFEGEFGGAVPCVGTADATDEYCTYLAFFPGPLLAKLYGEYGPRLLEKNVRSFLQAKGKINKGIRATILNDPLRWFALSFRFIPLWNYRRQAGGYSSVIPYAVAMSHASLARWRGNGWGK